MSAIRTLVVWCPDWPVVAAGAATISTVAAGAATISTVAAGAATISTVAAGAATISTVAAGAATISTVAVVTANRVVACSAAARAEGVQRGLRRRQAEARCPGLMVVAADPGAEARAFEPVAAAVEAFSPRVEIVRPGVCALATRGPSRYFGGDEALALRIAERVDATLPEAAPRCRVGVADGRFAAERAARLAATAAAASVNVIPPGQSAAFLASFPVSTLESDVAELLLRLGIRTLGDFAALPAKAVLARFGPEGATAHRLAQGLDERPLAARTPPPDLVVTAELDPPAERLETIAFVARSLAARLHDEVSARGLALCAVRVEAETDHGEFFSRCWRLDHATTPATVTPAAGAALAERVRWQLDGWLTASAGTRPSGPVTLLRLAPEEVAPDRGRQEGFWGGDRSAAERAARALERVQGRLGPEAVVRATVVGGRSPAEQVRLVPWGDPPSADVSPAADVSAVAPWPGRLPLPAPATVPSRPLPAEVVDAAGQAVTVSGRGTASAPPARLSVGGHPWTGVVAWAGPWPVEERWWDPAGHRRRARWQVVTVDGTAHLLSLEGGRWGVEATYD